MSIRVKNNNKCHFFVNCSICPKCGNKCLDEERCVLCEVCDKWFHIKCQKISVRKYNEMASDNKMYVCSEKCQSSLLPFSACDNVDFLCALHGEGLYPCNVCKRDCLDGMYCLQCDVCDDWFHVDCKYDDADAYDVIVDNHYEVICSDACFMKLLPFNGFKFGTLVRSNILNTTFDDHKLKKITKL